MRIVIDLQGAQTESRFRGIGRYATSIAKAIIRNNSQHDIFIALSSQFPETIAELKAEFKQLIPESNIIVWYGPGPVRAMETDNAWRSECAEYLREAFLHNLQPDIIFITSLFEGYVDSAVTSIAKLKTNCKVVVLHHDLIPLAQPEHYLNDPIFKNYYLKKIEWLKKADLLLTNSNYTASEAVDLLGMASEKVHSVSAATEEHFVPMRQSDDELNTVRRRYGISREVVLYAPGGFDPRKNFKRLIEAYSKLSPITRQEHQLVIVSKLSESDRNYLNTIAKQAQLRENELILTGYVSEQELIAFYQLAKLFVFASLHEGFGLPILEAMTCGAATIGSNVTSVPDVIGLEDALFDPYSIESIKNKMQQVLSDSNFHAQLKAHALQQAAQFSWDTVGCKALHYFEELLENSPKTEAAPITNEQLIPTLLAISANPAPSDNDLRATAAALDLNLKQQELQSLDVENLTWRVEGPYDSSYSLALVNREFARALDQAHVNVLLHSTEGPGDFDPNEDFLNQSQNADIKKFHQRLQDQADETVDVLSRNLYPPRVSQMNAKLKLLHNYAWEETGFPQEWIANFNVDLDAILCTSAHVRKVLIDNGTRIPVFNVGNGCDHWDQIQTGATVNLNAKSFKFLHVSSCFPRKGVQEMLAAYGQAFSADDDVSLIIKTFANPHNEISAWLQQAAQNHPNYPHVILIEEDMAAEDLKALYEYGDVLVAPSCAEGFGLPIAEAMLSGLPAITTGWSGQMDFCTPENSWLVDYQIGYAKTHFGLFSSSWALPDVDQLAQAMRAASSTSKIDLQAMAHHGRELISQHFTWAAVAQRSTAAVASLKNRFEATQQNSRIGWLSTWNTKCGIATYSQHLVENMHSDDVVILAPHATELITPDEPSVLRSWTIGKDSNYLESLDQKIESLNLNTLVIQFNYGFFNHKELATFIDKHHRMGRVIIMMMHATSDPLEKVPHWNFRLVEIADALQKCDRLLVHSIADVNRLKQLGIVNNVALFPHGVLDYPAAKSNRTKRKSIPLIASYGFCLPHKGLRELIEVVAHLKDTDQPIKLRLVNAEYPVEESTALVNELRALRSQLKVEDLVEMHNDFLDDKDSLRLLSDADLLVFAYQNTEESASGAVRYGMATQKPVAVTPLAIFNDLGDAVFKLQGKSTAELASDISEVLNSIQQNQASAVTTQQRADAWRTQHNYQGVATRLKNLCIGLLRAKQFS